MRGKINLDAPGLSDMLAIAFLHHEGDFMTSKYHDELLRLLEAVIRRPEQTPEWQTAMEALVKFLEHHLVARMQITSNRGIPEHELENMAREVMFRTKTGSGLVPRMLAKYPDVSIAYLRKAADNKVFDYFKSKSHGTNREISIDELEESAALSGRRNPMDRVVWKEWEVEQRQQYDEDQVQLLHKGLSRLSDDDRELLTIVYSDEKQIEKLAKEELARNPRVLRGSRTGQPRSIEEARDAVDQRLCRARKRLQEIVANLNTEKKGRDA